MKSGVETGRKKPVFRGWQIYLFRSAKPDKKSCFLRFFIPSCGLVPGGEANEFYGLLFPLISGFFVLIYRHVQQDTK